MRLVLDKLFSSLVSLFISHILCVSVLSSLQLEEARSNALSLEIFSSFVAHRFC